MDTSSPSPNVIQNPSAIKSKPVLLIMIFFLLLVLIIAALYFLKNSLLKPSSLPKVGDTSQVFRYQAKKDPSSPILKVGEEILYQKDFDYILNLYYPNEVKDNQITEEVVKKVLDILIADSVTLQEGQKNGYISLNDTVFNSAIKDMFARNTLIEAAKQKMNVEQVARISGEIISMWFNNETSYPPPSIGIEAAKIKVKEKMDLYYQDVKSNQLSMYQAAQKIRADTTLASIDPSYKGNAYRQFTNIDLSQSIFKDKEVEQLVWKMQEGEVSPVLLVRDFKNDKTPFEAYFAVVKITAKTTPPSTTFDNLLTSLRDKYEITNY